MNHVLTEPRPIRLKGRSFLALALSPELPFDDWLNRLDDLASRSAGFFLKRPVVLDVNGLDIDREQLRDLVAALGTRGVRVMGIEGARTSMLGSDLPPAMSDGRPASDVDVPSPEAIAPSEEPISQPTPSPQPVSSAVSVIAKQPIRSGQSLFHPEGDITVVGSVGSGAEVVASGSIHVYGALRGRAMAGIMGNSSARIFCRKLEAELVAIDGLYMTADDIEPQLRGKAVQIWLEGGSIKVELLS